MAQLTDNDRKIAWQDFMAELSANRDLTGALTKADIKAGVDALDAYFDTNSAAMNSAIPLPARNTLSQTQKAQMAIFVIRRRYLVGI